MMMKKIFGSAMVIVLSIFLSLAPVNSSVAAETSRFYAGIFGGYTFGSDMELKGDYYSGYNRSVDLDAQETLVVGAKFGYTMPFAKFLAAEFEYLYLGPDINRTVLSSSGSDYRAIEGEVDAHNFMFNFVAKYPQGRIHPFLGIGVGFSAVDFSATETTRKSGITSTYAMSEDKVGFAFQVLTGGNFEISKNFSVDLTYRYFMTTADDDYYDDYYYNSYNHGIETEIKSSMFTVGLNYHF
jgi:opacity protein-like surface antigen